MTPSPFQYELFRVLAPAAALVLLGILVASLSRGRRRGTLVFALFVIATIGYLLANLFENMSKSSEGSFFWSKMMYPFIVFIPTIWLDFCLRFARSGRGLGRAAVAALLVVPAITLVAVLVPSLNPLMWRDIQFFRQGEFAASRRSPGPWFVAYAAYTYSITVAGAVIAAQAFPRFRLKYRRQALWILAGIAFPLATSLLYVLHPFPGLIKDYTPLGYAVAGVFFYFALYRGDLFAFKPVERGHIVERMSDGVLVLDPEGRLVDANSTAMREFGIAESDLGSTIAEGRAEEGRAPRTLALPQEIVDVARMQGDREFVLERGGTTRFYRADGFPIGSRRGEDGVVIIVRDETAQHELLSRIAELASVDELTGLPNRRSFMDQASREISKAARQDLPLAAVMMDLDRFKEINDAHGHAAGDLVLRGFGALARRQLRGEDLIGRLGGDEFAIVVAGMGAEAAKVLCERLRAGVAATDFGDERTGPLRVTMSAGVAELMPGSRSLDELFARADRALYEAKERGRNAISVLEDEDPA